MANRSTNRRAVGGALMGFGLVVLLSVAGYLGWTQLRAAQVRAQLRQTAPIAAIDTPAGAAERAATPRSPTVTPAPTLAATRVRTATSVPPKPSQSAPTTAPALRAAASATPAQSEPTPEAASAASPETASEPGPPVRLVIPDPALKIDAAVVPMAWQVVQTADGPRSEWVIPKNDAGHHVDSALLGERGNVVISGHNNIYGQVFKPISLAWDNDSRVRVDAYTDRSDILNGRAIQLFDAAGRRFDYVITEFYRLRDTGVPLEQRLANARFMQPTEDARLTLITCWPPTNNTHRLVVVAVPAG